MNGFGQWIIVLRSHDLLPHIQPDFKTRRLPDRVQSLQFPEKVKFLRHNALVILRPKQCTSYSANITKFSSFCKH